MAKAEIIAKDGTKIQIEGTPEEISKIMEVYKEKSILEVPKNFKKFTKLSKSPTTLTDVIRELIAEGIFDKPKGLAEIKTLLESHGQFVQMGTLSERLLSLTRSRELRRMKQDDRWRYVKR